MSALRAFLTPWRSFTKCTNYTTLPTFGTRQASGTALQETFLEQARHSTCACRWGGKHRVSIPVTTCRSLFVHCFCKFMNKAWRETNCFILRAGHCGLQDVCPWDKKGWDLQRLSSRPQGWSWGARGSAWMVQTMMKQVGLDDATSITLDYTVDTHEWSKGESASARWHIACKMCTLECKAQTMDHMLVMLLLIFFPWPNVYSNKCSLWLIIVMGLTQRVHDW